MQDHKNLEVYKMAEKLTQTVYALTLKFPKEELYTMTQHVKKTILSVGANIAEGAGRQSDAEFLKFLYISAGSLKELDHFLNTATNLNYITKEEYEGFEIDCCAIGKKLSNLIKRIKRDKKVQATSYKPRANI